MPSPSDVPESYEQLAKRIKGWAFAAGFQQCGITSTDLGEHESHFQAWLARGYHGELDYMAKHGEKRFKPELLVPGTLRVISFRMNYHQNDPQLETNLGAPDKAYIAQYALGRDYHKTVRQKLKRISEQIRSEMEDLSIRAFVDSAPILERGFAQKAGLGWIGKNTMTINRESGSWFFLGEILTSLPLPVDEPYEKEHCGTCTACLEICPTNAFAGPYQLDSRKCISYLTIELKGSIPKALRKGIGNRIFGCDDCQHICPWNRFATQHGESDFSPRHALNNSTLVELFAWDEDTFLEKTAGSPIRRTGFTGWLRNIAVALGNAPTSSEVVEALNARQDYPDPMVREHVFWALQQHTDS